MKKILYIFIAVISFFMFDNVKAEETVSAEKIEKGKCTYNVGNVQLVVSQDGAGDINVSSSGEDSQNVFAGATFDRSRIKMNSSDFLSGNSLQCINITACKFEDVSNANADGTVPTKWFLTSNANENCAYKKTYSGAKTAETTCSYHKNLDGENCVIEVTEGAGNSVEYDTHGLGCNKVKIVLDEEVYYNNGVFACASGIWAIEPSNEGVTLYHFVNKNEDLNPQTPGMEVIPSEPTLPDVDDGIKDEFEQPDREYVTGCDMLGDKTITFINKIYGFFTWIIPVLIVILSIVDFIKVVGTGDDKDFKHAQSNLMKRIIIGIVFFLVPMVVKLFINISGITNNFTNGDGIIETITCVLK